MVVDSCGRMTYQVVMPWSSLQYPYVKAAIISTLIDPPCGPCNATQKKPERVDSQALNATLHVMKENRDNTQSKLVSIVNQYRPQSQTNETAENNDEVNSAVEATGGVLTNVTAFNDTEPTTNQGEIQLTEVADPTETNPQTNDDVTLTVSEDIPTETTEKRSKSKKKLKGKKHRSKTTSKRVDETTDEEQIPSTADMDLDRAVYESADNGVAAQVTLAPLRETRSGVVPLRVIMRSPHEHDGKNYEYLEMQLGNPGYHGHLEAAVSEAENGFSEIADDRVAAVAENEKMLEEGLKSVDSLISGVGYGDDVETDRATDDGEKEADGTEGVPSGAVIDAAKHEGEATRHEEKSDDANKKRKKTERTGKKGKGNKTKLTSLPEQDWMRADSRELPDGFNDIYPQANDFANDVREEESNHKNEETVLDDLTVNDLKYLIAEMGLEVDGNNGGVGNETEGAQSVAEVTEANVKADADADSPKNATVVKIGHHKAANLGNVTEKSHKVETGEESIAEEKDADVHETVALPHDTGVNNERHKSVNSITASEKPDKVKDLSENKSAGEGSASTEVVARKKVALIPTLSESESASAGSSKEIMEHYSKLLPWIDYRL